VWCGRAPSSGRAGGGIVVGVRRRIEQHRTAPHRSGGPSFLSGSGGTGVRQTAGTRGGEGSPGLASSDSSGLAVHGAKRPRELDGFGWSSVRGWCAGCTVPAH
jgi:hypothetical protein